MFLCLLLIAGISICNAQVTRNNPPIKPTVGLVSAADTLAYAAGSYIGSWIRNNGFQGIYSTLFFRKGMEDMLGNKGPILSDSVILAEVDRYVRNNAAASAKAQEQQFFSALRSKQGIGMLPGGVFYEVKVRGEGEIPAGSDSVLIHVRGQTLNRVSFVDTYTAGKPVMFAIKDLLKGLSEALQSMPKGSKWTVFVPSHLGYGDKPASSIIPANSGLVFEVELLEKVKVVK